MAKYRRIESRAAENPAPRESHFLDLHAPRENLSQLNTKTSEIKLKISSAKFIFENFES